MRLDLESSRNRVGWASARGVGADWASACWVGKAAASRVMEPVFSVVLERDAGWSEAVGQGRSAEDEGEDCQQSEDKASHDRRD